MAWTHTDPNLKQDVQSALDAASRGELNTVSLWRSWLVLACYTDAGLRGSLGWQQTAAGLTLQIDPNSSETTPERQAAAKTLYRTVELFAGAAGYQGQAVASNLETSAPREVGFLALIAAVGVVVVRLAAVGAVAYCVSKASDVVDGWLRRSDAAKELARTDAEARRYVDAHIDREQQAQKALPLDAATKLALENLKARQSVLAESLKAPPLAAKSWLAELFETPLTVLALGAVAYLFIQPNR